MSELKDYRVKVTEKHSDYVWVKARSSEEAKAMAPGFAECEFECLYDCEIVEVDEGSDPFWSENANRD